MSGKQYKRVLSIAGSDSGGCAGIQADIKTITSLGCYASTAITALTAQNTLGVRAIKEVDDCFLKEQIDAVLSDIGADAVKIGMLSSVSIVKTVAETLEKYNIPSIVVDPVLVATSGDVLYSDKPDQAILEYLLPMATVITPNRYEAERLSGEKDDDAIFESLEKMGAKAVLLKGGHTPINDVIIDKLYMTDAVFDFSHKKIDTCNTHGTGCSLSSAIASYLAMGNPLSRAVQFAVEWEVNAISSGAEFHAGNGNGPLDHFWAYRCE